MSSFFIRLFLAVSVLFIANAGPIQQNQADSFCELLSLTSDERRKEELANYEARQTPVSPVFSALKHCLKPSVTEHTPNLFICREIELLGDRKCQENPHLNLKDFVLSNEPCSDYSKALQKVPDSDFITFEMAGNQPPIPSVILTSLKHFETDSSGASDCDRICSEGMEPLCHLAVLLYTSTGDDSETPGKNANVLSPAIEAKNLTKAVDGSKRDPLINHDDILSEAVPGQTEETSSQSSEINRSTLSGKPGISNMKEKVPPVVNEEKGGDGKLQNPDSRGLEEDEIKQKGNSSPLENNATGKTAPKTHQKEEQPTLPALSGQTKTNDTKTSGTENSDSSNQTFKPTNPDTSDSLSKSISVAITGSSTTTSTTTAASSTETAPTVPKAPSMSEKETHPNENKPLEAADKSKPDDKVVNNLHPDEKDSTGVKDDGKLPPEKQDSTVAKDNGKLQPDKQDSTGDEDGKKLQSENQDSTGGKDGDKSQPGKEVSEEGKGSEKSQPDKQVSEGVKDDKNAAADNNQDSTDGKSDKNKSVDESDKTQPHQEDLAADEETQPSVGDSPDQELSKNDDSMAGGEPEKDGGEVQNNDQDIGNEGNPPANDMLNSQNSRSTGVFPQQENSHFFAYFLTVIIIIILAYLIVHNKQKILGLIVEGRGGQRRRSHSYRKLDTEGSKGTTQMIF